MADTEWMGRYRELVAAIVQHSNAIHKTMSNQFHIYGDIFLSQNEWQVLEYIVEHKNDDERMIFVSERLAIAQSSYSKIVKTLFEKGLVERVQTGNNKKNVIIKPSPMGEEAYSAHVTDMRNNLFGPFFDDLSTLSDDDIAVIAAAIHSLTGRL